MEMLHIDGSHGEGGGQIIRTSVTLAALTGTPVELDNIRAKRPKPGLQPQHLAAVRVAAMLCQAEMSGAEVGSTRLLFHPMSKASPGEYRYEIGTAGSTSLVAQTAALVLTSADGPAQLTVTGGTHVPFSPVYEYLEEVYCPMLRHAGLQVQSNIASLGFYPRGGGEIVIHTAPSHVRPMQLTARGKLLAAKATIDTASLPAHVAQRGQDTVRQELKWFGQPIDIIHRELPSYGPGAAVVISAICEGGFAGFTAIGQRGKPMERVAEEACRDFKRWWESGAAVDEHLADQLALPMALAPGHSAWTTPRVTEHLRTVFWVASNFLPIHYRMTERPGEPARIELWSEANISASSVQ